jgi:phosphatidylglycerol lysyltransferase
MDSASDRALELVQRHGWNATAFQTLGEGYEYFFHGDAVVAYVDTGRAWVVAGAPITALSSFAEVVQAFVERARASGRRVCFFGVERRFLAEVPEFRALFIGEQPVWNPRDWPRTLARHSSLREQLRRARAKGVRVRRLHPHEVETTSDLARRWLETRAMPAMGFLVRIGPFSFGDERRHFVAEKDGRIVGVAHVIPVSGRNGWFVEHLLRDPSAPNGTTETLVDAILRWAADEEKCTWVTLGLAPLAGDVPRLLGIARKRLALLYDFRGLQRFKAKLRPTDWDPIFVAHPRSQSAFGTTIDVLAAFATDGFLRFGARTVARGPSIVLGSLALLLVPWILLIAGSPSAEWFSGHAAVKWGWVVFDVFVVLGLVALLRRRSAWLATVLAILVSADAVATPIEAAFWNLPNLRGWFDALVVAAACIAPAFAAVVLWGARARITALAGAHSAMARSTSVSAQRRA